jgi:hypothetical protein
VPDDEAVHEEPAQAPLPDLQVPVTKLRDLFGEEWRKYLRPGPCGRWLAGSGETFVVFYPLSTSPNDEQHDATMPDDKGGHGTSAAPPRRFRWPRLSRRLTQRLGATESSPRGSQVFHPVTGNTFRAWITFILVLAVIVIVLGGMFARTAPGDLSQYAAPISTLASLALGYWFGAEK